MEVQLPFGTSLKALPCQSAVLVPAQVVPRAGVAVVLSLDRRAETGLELARLDESGVLGLDVLLRGGKFLCACRDGGQRAERGGEGAGDEGGQHTIGHEYSPLMNGQMTAAMAEVGPFGPPNSRFGSAAQRFSAACGFCRGSRKLKMNVMIHDDAPARQSPFWGGLHPLDQVRRLSSVKIDHAASKQARVDRVRTPAENGEGRGVQSLQTRQPAERAAGPDECRCREDRADAGGEAGADAGKKRRCNHEHAGPGPGGRIARRGRAERHERSRRNAQQ